MWDALYGAAAVDRNGSNYIGLTGGEADPPGRYALANEKTRTEAFEAIVKFLATHLGPGGPRQRRGSSRPRWIWAFSPRRFAPSLGGVSELPPPDPLPLVRQHLPALTAAQLEQLGRLAALVRAWNERVNLVSRKDVEHLEEHHLLHSLVATRVLKLAAGAHVADVGTGGGFPGLPLAIAFPHAKFTLIDSVAKKGRAITDIAAALGLSNVRVLTVRAEKVRDRFDYVFGRAVAALPEFLRWTAPLVRAGAKGEPANGIFYFKGTKWREELAGGRAQPATVWSLPEFAPLPYFEGKLLLHFPAPLPL